MPTPREILQQARDFLAVPEHWTKGAFWRDADGAALNSTKPENRERAVCACLDGALKLVAADDYAAYFGAAQRLYQHISEPFFDIWAFNDNRSTTHADVLNLLDKALQS